MSVGRFEYDGSRERWSIVDGDGREVRELHCGDVLDVRPCDDEGAPWLSVRVELDGRGWWYMVEPDGHERDDFELLDVRCEGLGHV